VLRRPLAWLADDPSPGQKARRQLDRVEMITRTAGAEDAGPIARLHAASWRDAYSKILDAEFLAGPIEAERLDFWTHRLAQADARLRVLVALDGEAVVGFTCVIVNDDAIWGSRVDNLHVVPSRRGGGIGERLLKEAAIELAEASEGRGLYLWVFEANTKGRRFYERLGAQTVERSSSQIPSACGKPVLRLYWPDARTLAIGSSRRRGRL